MKYSFYQNFIQALYNNGFKQAYFQNTFIKFFEGVFYFIYPVINPQNIQEVNDKINVYQKFLQDNLNKFNVNKVVFLKLFIFDDFNQEFFKNIEDNFDIHSQILLVDWAFDVNKNEIFVRKNHISKILNLQFIIKNSSLNTSELDLQTKKYVSFKKNKIFLTFSLILVNFIVYLYANIINKDNFYNIIQEFAISSAVINNFEFYRLFTAIFLHLDFMHLISNSLSLYIFGIITENLIGKIPFITCYFLGGFLGGLLSSFFNTGFSIGASGAIFAIEGALVHFYLKEKNNFKNLNLYQLIILIIVSIFIGIFIPNVDNLAHLGGFIGGFILIGIFYKFKKS